MSEDKLFFSSEKEGREKYFVEYSPPHHGYRYASLSLTYTEKVNFDFVAQDIESEGHLWLRRYSIPLMVSAFDETGSLIHLDDVRPESHFTCFYGSDGGSIQGHWALLKDEAIPNLALDREYLLRVYSEFKIRTSSKIRVEVEKDVRQRRLGMRIIFLWVVVVPAIVALVEFFAPQWLAVLVLIYSLSMALIKGLKMKGKIKKSKAELEKEAELQRMKHHHYHCERNPEGFLKLKLENFERMARENVKREAASLKAPGS